MWGFEVGGVWSWSFSFVMGYNGSWIFLNVSELYNVFGVEVVGVNCSVFGEFGEV